MKAIPGLERPKIPFEGPLPPGEAGPTTEPMPATAAPPEREAAVRINGQPLDKSIGAEITSTADIRGNANVNINVKGQVAGVDASADGVFKKTEITRAPQMEPAATGPTASA